MHISFFTNILSPHQLPLAKALVEMIGCENYKYIYTQPLHDERANMGWSNNAPSWTLQGDEQSEELNNSDLLLTGNRAIKLIESRLQNHKKTIYCSERWFKPSLGMVRLFSPSFLKMAFKFMSFLKSNDFMYFPMGIHAALDFIKLNQLLSGNLSLFTKRHALAFESYPGGKIVPLEEAINTGVLDKSEIEFAKNYGFVQIPKKYWGYCTPKGIYNKMRIWGYFVSPTVCKENIHLHEGKIKKILWVGRMLKWKQVDTLIRAVSYICNINEKDKTYELHLYGEGEAKNILKRLAGKNSNIHFHPFITVEEVRNVMRQHDIYVLPSNAYEGWGAVINEALEEGMHVFASLESGSGATILPTYALFPTKDYYKLSNLILNNNGAVNIREWNPEYAARFLINSFICK